MQPRSRRRVAALRPLCVPISLLWCLDAAPALALGVLAGGIVENRGQAADPVLYHASCGEGTVYFTDAAVVLDLPRQRHAIWMRFVGASRPASLEARGEQPARVHCFTGADPSRWRSDLRLFAEVVYREVWPGIDVSFRLHGGQLRYRIAAAPGRDAGEARFAFDGADRTTTAADGTVRLSIPQCVLTDAPAASDGAVRILRWTTGSEAGGKLPRVHDNPSALAWSTLLGGADNEYSHGLAVDAADRPVVTGYTRSADFPTSPGAYDSTQAGSYDVFVAKLDATGSSLLWATFIGGSQEDRPFALALDRSGNAVVAGHTFSPDFPTTQGALDRTLGGPRDVFVTKLDAGGGALLWSTYLGGGAWERAWGLALDAGDRPVVAGETSSADYPTTAGALDATLGGPVDAFVTTLDSDARTVAWSTFLGGAGSDWANALALDSSQRPVVVGTTDSGDFPVAAAYDSTHNGGWDGFVAKLGSDGGSVVYSTYLGGSGSDVAYALGVNARGRAVVTGSTHSADFPVAPGAFDTSYNGGGDIFVAESDERALAWSTFIGGSDIEDAFAMILDHGGGAIVSGETSSVDLPTSWDAFDRVYGGNQDAFVARLDATGASLLWSSYLGGGQWDSGWDFALDAAGNPLLTGPTRSGDFPTTDGAYDRSYNGGGEDAFLVRLAIAPATDSSAPVSLSGALSALPNPFHASVQVRFHLVRRADVQLRVFDAAGRRVVAMAPGLHSAGARALVWSGLDAHGRRVPPGVYWLRLDAGNQVLQTRVVRVPR